MRSTRSLFHNEALDSDDNSDDEESDKGSSMDDFIVDSEEETEEDVDLASLQSDDIALGAILQGKLNPKQAKINARAKVAARKDSRALQPAVAVDGTTSTSTSTTPKKRGRPSGAVNRNVCTPDKKDRTVESPAKPPGHEHYPINDFSLIVSKTKGDVCPTLIEVIYEFIKTYCLKGGVSTEVGHRAHNLHLQSAFRIKFPRDEASVKKLTKIIKEMIKDHLHCLTGIRVFLKPLGKSQSFTLMMGYIVKDEGQSHFTIRLHNVTNEELQGGRVQHSSMASTYDEDRKIVTMKNFFVECYKFNKRSFAPFVVSVDYVLLYMIQSKQYCLTPDFISCYRKIDFKEANILWKAIHEPSETSIEMVRAIVFDPRTYDNFRARQRYFVPGMSDVAVDMPSTASSIAAVRPEGNARVCKASRLVQYMRGSSNSTDIKERQFPSSEEEFISLPATPPTVCQFGDSTFECPSTLDEMLKLVNDARSRTSRTQALMATFGPRMVNEDDIESCEDQDVPPKRQRTDTNDDPYDMFC